MGFYLNIRNQYGVKAVTLLKRWSKLNNKNANLLNRRIFLLECKRKGICPNHISNNTKHLYQLFEGYNGKLMKKIEDFNLRLIVKIIKFEITYTNDCLSKLTRDLKLIEIELNNVLPKFIIDNFKSKQLVYFNKIFHKIKVTNLNKIQKLEVLNKIEPKIKDKWFKNISSTVIPDYIKNFLALGPKFNLKVSVRDIPLQKLLADIEFLLSQVEDSKRNLYRAKITNIITQHLHKFKDIRFPTDIVFSKVKKFMTNHPNIILLKSDKGGVSVLMDKTDYMDKMNDMLKDVNSFKLLNKDPTLVIQTKANKIITNLEISRIINKVKAKSLRTYNAVCPKIYGNPKIHKDGNPLRPIVSSIQGPVTNLAGFVAEILTTAYNRNNDYFISDSFHFAEFINGKEIPSNYVIISLDVVNLFGNISKPLVIRTLQQKWDDIKDTCVGISKSLFLDLVSFVLDNNYFTFNNQYFLQIFGCAMGSKLSPILAQYVMDFLLDSCIPLLSFQLGFIKKFVDDLILALPADGIDEIINIFGQFDHYIKFTVEKELNYCVPFLDTKVFRINNIIRLDWYQKPTASGRYISYMSDHPIGMKINFIKQLKNRITKICHNSFINKNLKLLQNLLLDNSYPRPLISKILFSTSNPIPELINQSDNISTENNDQVKFLYGSLPQINLLTNKIINEFKLTKLKIAKRSIKNVGLLFSKLKDKDPIMFQSNCIYKLSCLDCNQTYVGQTTQLVKNRIAGHKSDCNKRAERCALATHVAKNKHTIAFTDVQLLAKEPNYTKRTFLEMFYINKQNNPMNKKSDVNNLSAIYTYLLQFPNNFYNKTLVNNS